MNMMSTAEYNNPVEPEPEPDNTDERDPTV